ncbi:MAG: hypothetical protein V1850_05040 [Candidatus Bathyarchaeota archaeon]
MMAEKLLGVNRIEKNANSKITQKIEEVVWFDYLDLLITVLSEQLDRLTVN